MRGGDTILVDMAHTQIQDGQVFVIRDGSAPGQAPAAQAGRCDTGHQRQPSLPEFEATADSLHVVGRAVWKGGLI